MTWRRNLQRRLGVTVDGILGRGSYTALCRHLGAGPERAAELALGCNVHLPRYQIDANALRFAHFFAQVGHESGGFRYMEEIASGAAYEGRKDLGNTQPGDGVRYKGRGPIQITGRANYRTFGRRIGIDIEASPQLAAIPSIGLHLACAYWDDRRLNVPADRDDILAITRAINGGTNGLDDRRRYLGILKGLVA